MRTTALELLTWLEPQKLADLAGVDRTTAMRWRRGQHRAPYAVLRLAEMELSGALGPAAGAAWPGWCFDRDGWLCSPYSPRFRIEAGELNAYLWLRYQGQSQKQVAEQLQHCETCL